MADEPKKTLAAGVAPAHFMDGYGERVTLLSFLDASYGGGVSYKSSRDAMGHKVLIEHEQECPDIAGELAVEAVAGGRTMDNIIQSRYHRRVRIAAYENHVKPIVDKFTAYLLRNPPKREAGKVTDEAPRLKLDEFFRDATEEALKLTETWIGVDAATLPEKSQITGAPLTQAEVEVLDPKNAGKAYLVSADPRRVVDYDELPDGTCTRCVIMETETTKASILTKAATEVFLKEWTKDGWTRYQVVDEDGNAVKYATTAVELGAEVLVKLDTSGKHSFKGCPWRRIHPAFPIEDIAELNRAIFNLSSLLDEEIWNAVFTQRIFFGIKPQDLALAIKGSGRWMAIDNPSAKLDNIGADPDMARIIQERIGELKAALYQIVSMEVGAKNVAEAAEKKKRDQESLYTSLIGLIGHIEDAENWVLKLLDLIEEDKGQTVYDRHFDVNSVQDLMDDIKATSDIPLIPASFKRSHVQKLVQKLDPFGPHEEYTEDIKKSMDLSAGAVDAIVSLKAAGYMSDGLAAFMLGVPEDQLADFIKAATGHAEDERAAAQAQADAMNGGTDGGEDEEGADEGADGSSGAGDAEAKPGPGGARGARGVPGRRPGVTA